MRPIADRNLVVQMFMDRDRTARRVNLTPLPTHRFSLDEIVQGYRIFGGRSEGVLKVAMKP
jgi:threonine dehydrogenase-like Zn-dependent dehydrogenase